MSDEIEISFEINAIQRRPLREVILYSEGVSDWQTVDRIIRGKFAMDWRHKIRFILCGKETIIRDLDDWDAFMKEHGK